MASNDAPEAVVPSEKAAMDAGKDYYAEDHITRLKATDRVIQGAKTATEKEQSMTLMQGIRLYPKAIAWSILISTCIVMEGYDVCLINNFCRSPHPLFRDGCWMAH
jgi:SP family general alpha glucoside:H+ symporter-like MFS transporter